MLGWLQKLFQKRSEADWLRGRSATNVTSGVYIDETTALNVSTVFACVKVLAEDMASLSLPVYARLGNGGKIRATDHAVYNLLHDAPNPEMTSMQFREGLLQWLLRYGNGFAEIERNRAGQPLYLWLLPATKVKPIRTNGQLVYELNDNGRRLVQMHNMIHVRLMGDGLVGWSPIRMARETIGLAKSTEQFGSAFFGNGSRPGGVLTHPAKLSDEAQKNLRESINDVHGGPSQFGKWMILQEGMTVTPHSIPPEDAQFLSTRQFQRTEICGLFRIPPHMIGDLERATFSNVEQQSLDYITNTLRPLAVRIEQEFNHKLFTPEERRVFFSEHLLDSLLRGDVQSRTSALQTQFLHGVLNQDEWRAIENRNPLPDGLGQKYYVPLNMTTVEKMNADPVEVEPVMADDQDEMPPVEDETDAIRSQLQLLHSELAELRKSPQISDDHKQAAEDVLADALARMNRRETKAIIKASKKPKQFLTPVDEFYDEHQRFMVDAIGPAMRAWSVVVDAGVDAADVAKTICDDHRKSLFQLAGEVTVDKLEEQVSVCVAGWGVSESIEIPIRIHHIISP